MSTNIDNIKLTIAALCDELEKEDVERQNNEGNQNHEEYSEDDYRKKLKNIRKSGIDVANIG